MSTHTFQLAGKAAEVYETQKVPAIFKPLAELTVERAQPHAEDRVLELGGRLLLSVRRREIRRYCW